MFPHLKQWGRARKRIGELIKLGAPKHEAILTGLSRKGSPVNGYPASCQDVRDQQRIVKGVPTKPGACFTTHIVDRDSLSGYGPMTSSNRHVRTRTRGGVGRDGEKPSLTRLGMIGFSPLSEPPCNPLINAASTRTRPNRGIHACKRRSARVPRLVWLEHLSQTRRRDWL